MRIFKEEQRFRQLWLIMLMIISTLIPVGIILATYIKDPNSFTKIELATILCIVLLASGILFVFKLITRIDEKGIHYKFYPIHWSFKTIEWNNISKVYIRQYDAIGEFGGWGLKGGSLWNKSKGKAINISGDIGIQLELKNEKKILIGTLKKDSVIKVLETYQNKINK